VGAGPGEFLGRGVYGQYLYIDQAKDVVIVATGADRNFREPGVTEDFIDMLRTIAAGL
jgi:CubicO group peptidase (beta-lactamase class C family)